MINLSFNRLSWEIFITFSQPANSTLLSKTTCMHFMVENKLKMNRCDRERHMQCINCARNFNPKKCRYTGDSDI